jgi:hypothetical protein
MFFSRLKKGKCCFVWCFYGRFLSAKKRTANPIITTTIIAMTAGTKYVSTTDAGAGVVGAAVADGILADCRIRSRPISETPFEEYTAPAHCPTIWNPWI